MKFGYRFALFTGILALAAATCPAQTPEAAPAFSPERISGRIINTGAGAGSLHFTLQIDELSSDEEIAGLRTMLAEKGDQAVVRTLEDMPSKGWLKIGNSLGYQVSVIRSLPLEGGGRVVRVVTDRNLMFVESMNATRSKKYRFGIVEIILGPDDTGEGVVIAAARFKFNKEGQLEIESYGTGPVKILNAQAKPNSEK